MLNAHINTRLHMYMHMHVHVRVQGPIYSWIIQVIARLMIQVHILGGGGDLPAPLD